MVIEDWWNLETGELYLSGFLLRWLQGKVYYFGQIFSLKTSSFFCSVLLVVFQRTLELRNIRAPLWCQSSDVLNGDRERGVDGVGACPKYCHGVWLAI